MPQWKASTSRIAGRRGRTYGQEIVYIDNDCCLLKRERGPVVGACRFPGALLGLGRHCVDVVVDQSGVQVIQMVIDSREKVER